MSVGVGGSRATGEARGVYTLLFTDIEGSTRLWETHGDRMEAVVQDHNELISSLVTAAGGVVVRFMGDGVFARFAVAGDAVAAAVDIQRAFRARRWAGVGEIRVRAGLNTGPCMIDRGEVFGRAPNLAARLESAAHGGQILLSDTTATATTGCLRSGEQLFDLGRFHIRGFDEPVVVHSVLADGLGAEFPPPRTPYRGFDELPVDDSPLYGRERTVAEVEALLSRHPLVTLWGPGGIGKTRVALQVAGKARRPYENGVRFVDLSVAEEASDVATAVASALRAQPTASETAQSTVLRVLRHARLLLLLDNCEGVLDGVRELVGAILVGCDDPHVLATSREALGLRQECAVEIGPLATPQEGEADAGRARRYDAVRLFVARAQQSDPSFALDARTARSVTGLCRALDGMPLALELAASRLDVETIHDLATDTSSLLARLAEQSRPGEHRRDLLASVGTAVARLSPGEVDLFRRLATFAGSFSRSSALRLSTEPARAHRSFDRLVRTSLVVSDPVSPGRFRLLATAREYSRSLTSEAQSEAYRRAHAALMLERAEALEPGLYSREEEDCVGTLQADFADCRAAVEHLLDHGDDVAAARLVVALFQFALLQPRPEVYGWASTVADRIDDAAPKAAEVIGAAALGAWFGADIDRAITLGTRAVEVAAAYGGSPRLGRTALVDALGTTGRLDEASAHAVELLREHRRSESLYWQVGGLVYSAIGHTIAGRAAEAVNRAEQALALARRLGNPSATRWAAHGLGLALAPDDEVAASAAFEQAMAAARQVDSRFGLSLALCEWVDLKRRMGDIPSAVLGTSDLLEILVVSGIRSQLAQALCQAGLLLADAGRDAVAALVLLGRRGLPEMPLPPGRGPADAAHLKRLRAALGEDWVAVSIRAKALDEHELISLCRAELASLADRA